MIHLYTSLIVMNEIIGIFDFFHFLFVVVVVVVPRAIALCQISYYFDNNLSRHTRDR